MKKILTQSKLKSLVSYDSDTGVFLWVSPQAKRMSAGDVAGSINKSSGYNHIKINSMPYKAHRLAWLYFYGEFPKNDIDHVNGIKSDNSISNLRDVDHSVNCMNAAKPKNNKSGIVGVCWEKAAKKWSAQIKVNYKQIHLGRFFNIFDAACARKSAEVKLGFHANHGRSSL